MMLGLRAMVLGGVIGLAFGTLQRAAFLNNLARSDAASGPGSPCSVSGSVRRIVFLFSALIAVQIVCPVFFQAPEIRWCVSLGVVMGYGWSLVNRTREQSLS